MNSEIVLLKTSIALLVLAISALFLSFLNYDFIVALIIFVVLFSYIIMRPSYFLNPINMVFAFHVLFLVIPMSVDYLYSTFGIEYQLPWGRLWDWSEISLITYVEVLAIYIVSMISIFLFIGRDGQNEFNIKSVDYLVLHGLFSIMIMLFFVGKTGGFSNWFLNYKEAYLLGRYGNGVLNFVFIFSVNIFIFLLGIKFYHTQNITIKRMLLIFSIFIVLFFSYFQGLKSRSIILMFLFFSPYVINLKLSYSKTIIGGMIFFVLLFFLTYIRSDGFYKSPAMFIEYTMTYFNAIPLHNIVVESGTLAWFDTVGLILNKYYAFIGISNNDLFDLSVLLTQEYFPSDWETMKATQQWPLHTDFRYNYYGVFGGVFLLILYLFLICLFYKKAKSGSLVFLFIFVLEFFRVFSVFRGAIIPWQIFIYVFFYFISAVLIKFSVKSYR